MINRERLVELYRDTHFKTTFIAAYLNNGFKEHKAEEQYNHLFNMLAEETTDGSVHVSCAPSDELRKRVLSIANDGLNFDPNAKEILLKGYLTEDKRPAVASILRYRGMHRLVAACPDIRIHSTQIVYESDSFTWLGSEMRPSFASNGRNQNTNIVCGFTVFTLKDGSVICYKVSAEELMAVVEMNLKMIADFGGQPTDSLYNTAWRDRCLRIVTFRMAFREYQHLFSRNDTMTLEGEENNTTNTVNVSPNLAAILETELQQSANA
ncbi:MAG: hypothetical protein GJ680_18120 [Alteromonadaceae bacterium]|nr:hypothetical protein [Alteromonadaceae bacterium]